MTGLGLFGTYYFLCLVCLGCCPLQWESCSQVDMGPMWVGKGKRLGGLLLCVLSGQFGRKGTIGRSITRNFLIRELSLLFFVIFGHGPNCL